MFFKVPLDQLLHDSPQHPLNLIDPLPIGSLLQSCGYYKAQIIWVYVLALEGNKHRNAINCLCQQLLTVLLESNDAMIDKAIMNYDSRRQPQIDAAQRSNLHLDHHTAHSNQLAFIFER
jgi:hypothetical protein